MVKMANMTKAESVKLPFSRCKGITVAGDCLWSQ
jgi:hypothetical protein